MSIPRAPNMFPRTAVLGWESPFSPKMKREAERRYAKVTKLSILNPSS